jgi:hypothetical protein
LFIRNNETRTTVPLGAGLDLLLACGKTPLHGFFIAPSKNIVCCFPSDGNRAVGIFSSVKEIIRVIANNISICQACVRLKEKSNHKKYGNSRGALGGTLRYQGLVRAKHCVSFYVRSNRKVA